VNRRRFLAAVPALAAAPLLHASPPENEPAHSFVAIAVRSTLRIGLWTLWHDHELTLTPATTGTMRRCLACAAAPLTIPVTINADGDSVHIAGSTPVSSLTLDGAFTLAAHNETLTLRHPLRITSRRGQLILAVTLPVETYVERVVASESGPTDSPESLKALAIVVRSFALHQRHGHTDYDLCDSTHCQLLHWANPSRRAVYAGPGQGSQAHRAALSTASETLWYRGRRAQAWFHQNCGGRTAAPSEVWPPSPHATNVSPMPWLTSHADAFCTSHGARTWSTSISVADITAALALAGLVTPGWKTLTIARRGESGRAVLLRIGDQEIRAEDFRLAIGRTLGWGRILSTWFEVSPQYSASGPAFDFHGRGSGHGVGLCQAGAAQMAAQGNTCPQILDQYFHGATLADEASGRAWQSVRGPGFDLETLEPNATNYLKPIVEVLVEAERACGFGENAPGHRITVRAFPTVQAFRDATLAPGWVAAFTEGDWIGTQPLATLTSRKLLVPTLRHEFLHVLLERQSAPSTPLWLREGLAEVLLESQTRPRSRADGTSQLKLAQVDQALTHAATEADSHAAHNAAAFYTRRLIEHYGRDQVLAWLRSGLPLALLNSIQ
jgi:stage II sporulation protein D